MNMQEDKTDDSLGEEIVKIVKIVDKGYAYITKTQLEEMLKKANGNGIFVDIGIRASRLPSGKLSCTIII
jgi:DNA primase large subunit